MRTTFRSALAASLLCGAVLGGTSDRSAVPLKAGSYMLHPAKALHWDGSNSDEEVIVQIIGIGPADTVQADPSQPFWVRVER